MKRREAIRNSVLFLGAISLTNGALLQSCKPSMEDDWVPLFLDENQSILLDEIAECILPRTDTPGAKDAKVMRYLDEYAHFFLKSEEKEKYKLSLQVFDDMAQSIFQKNFVAGTMEEKGNVLQAMFDDEKRGDESPHEIFLQIRSSVNRAFFSSEIGATQVLDYIPIPGNYDGNIALSDTKGLVYSG